MNGWLLDTNILSELRRPRPHPAVVAFVAEQSLERLYTSSVCLAEIRFGIERVDDAMRRAALHDWLEQQVRPMFAQRVLPVSEDVMFRWRLMVELGRQIGHTYSQPDLIIGATAQQFGLTLVTRNVNDFTKLPIRLLNPFESET